MMPNETHFQVRVKATMFIEDAASALLSEHAALRANPQTAYMATVVTVIRTELRSLLEILNDQGSPKHGKVARRVAECALILEKMLQNAKIRIAWENLMAANKSLRDEEDLRSCSASSFAT